MVVTEYSTTKTNPTTEQVKLSVKNCDELCFKYSSGKSTHPVDEDGNITGQQEDLTAGQSMTSLSGQFIGTDSLHLIYTQYYDYTIYQRLVDGVKIK